MVLEVIIVPPSLTVLDTVTFPRVYDQTKWINATNEYCIHTSQDYSGELVEVGPGVVLYAPDAQILQLIRSGDECPAGAENFGDLVALAFLLADQDFVKARELADKIAISRRPMFLLPSSSLVDSTNKNHLKKNPFRR